MAKAYSPEEIAIIKRTYPEGGADAVLKVLPGRTRAGIATFATTHGLKLSKETRSAIQTKNSGRRGQGKAHTKSKPVATIDTVPPEFKRVASVFHIGERIKK